MVHWNCDRRHSFSPVKGNDHSAAAYCGVATTATCEKRYLPNGLVSLLQSIEASVARRPLGLQLGWRFRDEPSFPTSRPLSVNWFLSPYPRWFITAGTRRSRPRSNVCVTGVAACGRFLNSHLRLAQQGMVSAGADRAFISRIRQGLCDFLDVNG